MLKPIVPHLPFQRKTPNLSRPPADPRPRILPGARHITASVGGFPPGGFTHSSIRHALPVSASRPGLLSHPLILWLAGRGWHPASLLFGEVS